MCLFTRKRECTSNVKNRAMEENVWDVLCAFGITCMAFGCVFVISLAAYVAARWVSQWTDRK